MSNPPTDVSGPSAVGDPSTCADGYVALNIGGVQRFIAAARTTGDLAAGSAIMSALARAAVARLTLRTDCQVILPAPGRASDFGQPNRLWIAAGDMAVAGKIAQDAEDAIRGTWRGLMRTLDPQMAAADLGFPEVRWVATATDAGPAGDYQLAWKNMGRALDERKRQRDFGALTGAPGGQICSSCALRPQWRGDPPRGVRTRAGETLCAVCCVKRSLRQIDRRAPQAGLVTGAPFPSTAGVATAPFRAAVAGRIDEEPVGRAAAALRGAVDRLNEWLAGDGHEPVATNLAGALSIMADVRAARFLAIDGDWCYPESWTTGSVRRDLGVSALDDDPRLAEVLAEGAQAARDLARAVGFPPAIYLAVLAQDADRMGRSLGGSPNPYGGAAITPDQEWHSQVSGELMALATERYRPAIEETALGRIVYSGGDDLLALVPLAGALGAASACRFALSEAGRFPGLTASSGLVVFHHSHPLQSGLERVRAALHEAKEAGRDRLAIAVLRRGGERASEVFPWRTAGVDPAGRLADLAARFHAQHLPDSGGLSAAIIRDLGRESDGLAGLEDSRAQAMARRLFARHGGSAQDAEHLFGLFHRVAPAAWVDALVTAHFFRQEAR